MSTERAERAAPAARGRARVSGRDIFDANGMCLSCRGRETQHRLHVCGRLAQPDMRAPGAPAICGGACLYRIHADGNATLCSVCPFCLLPPPRTAAAFRSKHADRRGSRGSRGHK